jgi:hypothetical protein
MQNTETAVNTAEAEHFLRVMKGVWLVAYLIGFITLILGLVGTVYNEFNGLYGTQDGGWLTLILPLFIGIPAVLLSMIYAFAYRLNRFPISAILLPVYWLVIGCIACLLIVILGLCCLLAGHPLGIVLKIPLLIGIPATILPIKSAFVSRPSRQHLSAMVLLAHILLYAVNVVCGIIACC